MGMNICLTNDQKAHDDWDDTRQGSDRMFPDLIDFDKVVFKTCEKEEFRPENIEELGHKVLATGWPDRGRYLRLLDLIKNNPDYWLYFSY